MSGAGRKSYYRKGATQYFESDELELSSTDRIGKILSNRGANIFDIQVTASPDEAIMVKLPTKFHKVVWVKVKDYVVIEEFSSKDEIPLIKYVLNKEHIKYLKKEGRWPEFLEEGDSEDNKLKPNKSNIVNNYMSDILPDNYEEYEEEEEEYDEENTEEGGI